MCVYGATVQGVPLPLPKVLPLPLQDVTTRRRFAEPVDSTILDKASKGVVPEKMEASTQWAVKNFESWARNRSSSASEIVPPGILHSHDPELVCTWLCCFVLETRKLDGSRYPPATIRSLVSGLNRELQRHSAPFSVLDKGDYRFRALLKTLDSVSCELQCFIEIKGSIEHSVRI